MAKNDPLEKYKNNKPEKGISTGRLTRSDAVVHKSPWMGYQPQGSLRFNPNAKLDTSQVQDRRGETRMSNAEALKWNQQKWKEIGANRNGWGTKADIGPNERALGDKWNNPLAARSNAIKRAGERYVR